jgi:hypothetical protein
MINSYCDLDYSIVAFVDILGFSEMVKSDCENKNGSLKFFEILKDINIKTKEISGCNITQFSDSVIFSLPLKEDNYEKMLQILSDYQYKLFCNSIVCRGAVAYGKHYIENEFMFSQALIEAYQLECNDAKYPRIIISPNLKEFFAPKCEQISSVIKEKDEYYFINYFEGRDKDKLRKILQTYNSNLSQYALRVREKYYWLFEYWEFVFHEKLPFNKQRFFKQ